MSWQTWNMKLDQSLHTAPSIYLTFSCKNDAAHSVYASKRILASVHNFGYDYAQGFHDSQLNKWYACFWRNLTMSIVNIDLIPGLSMLRKSLKIYINILLPVIPMATCIELHAQDLSLPRTRISWRWIYLKNFSFCLAANFLLLWRV